MTSGYTLSLPKVGKQDDIFWLNTIQTLQSYSFFFLGTIKMCKVCPRATRHLLHLYVVETNSSILCHLLDCDANLLQKWGCQWQHHDQRTATGVEDVSQDVEVHHARRSAPAQTNGDGEYDDSC